MAKAASRGNTTSRSRIESKVVDYAEELGRLLGTVRARVDGMGTERRKLVQQLSGVVKDAQALLSELGHEAAEQVGRFAKATGRRGKRKSVRIPKGAAGGPDAKTHRLPASARQKMTKRRGD